MGLQGVTLNQWKTGIDVRRGATVASPQSFRELLNCYLTPGRVVQKRPGMRAVCAVLHPTGQPELDRAVVAVPGGTLLVATGSALDWTDGVSPVSPLASGGVSVAGTGWQGGVNAAGATNQGAYLIQNQGGAIRHVWHTTNDAPANNVPNATDPGWDTANFPGPVFTAPGAAMTTLAERFYATDGNLVRMSDVVDPRNWLPPTGTQTQLAGFLNVGLHQSGGSRRPTALGRYRDRLVVFFGASAQVWTVDPDPKLHKLDTMVDGVGCRWPRAVTNISGDCIALSDNGLRSISIVDAFGNISDVDVGSAVDDLVVASVAAMPNAPGVEPCAVYSPKRQQAWFAIGQDVWVLTFSRTMQVSAWSHYVMPAPVVWLEEMGGEVYVRCRFMQAGANHDYYDVLYVPDEARYADDYFDPATNTVTQQPFQVRAEMPFLDLGAPGALKTLYAWDAVVQGTATVSFRLNPADPTEATAPIEVAGDTRPGASIPVQASAVSIQPVIEDFDSNPWRFEGLTLYFQGRGLR